MSVYFCSPAIHACFLYIMCTHYTIMQTYNVHVSLTGNIKVDKSCCHAVAKISSDCIIIQYLLGVLYFDYNTP